MLLCFMLMLRLGPIDLVVHCGASYGHCSGVFRGGSPPLPGNNMITWKFDVQYNSARQAKKNTCVSGQTVSPKSTRARGL